MYNSPGQDHHLDMRCSIYSLSGSDDIQSLVNTTDTTYIVTSGLTQDQTYEFFVVSYGNDSTPVLPSVNSSIESVTLSK